ncbi:hypothetical protein BD410DRAFT_583940 [Rickenella mellea]|uniref:DUF7918 domain-containing protein n=1 Tax=Rickenella mellea TaxID=50990 RepID=A0A4Y7PNT2_9AGAM|nr:hypothetical protein BD410DRAFT_583940 [Rickenella mellea]
MLLGNYEALVQCDGAPLPEHGVLVEGQTVSCWIPSQVGKAFTISWQQHGRTVASRGYVSVDGTCVGVATRHGNDALQRQVHKGVDSNDLEHKYHPFTFAPINLTDNPALPVKKRDITSLGTIVVEIFEAERGRECMCIRAGLQVNLHDDPIHEREKKLGGHRILLGAGIKRERPAQVSSRPAKPHRHWRRIDPNRPLATFRFKYQSNAEFLQAEGIIPKPVVPITDTPPRDDVLSNRNGRIRCKSNVEDTGGYSAENHVQNSSGEDKIITDEGKDGKADLIRQALKEKTTQTKRQPQISIDSDSDVELIEVSKRRRKDYTSKVYDDVIVLSSDDE